MKIMYLMFSFTIGGTERLIVDICNEMVEQHQDVYLYIVNDLYSDSLLATLNKSVHVELQNRCVGSKNKLQTIIRISEFIRKNKIDVIHCNSFNAPDLLLLRYVLFRKTKVMHTIHDVGQYKNLGKLKCWYRNIICDQFIAISDSVKKDIILYGADSKKISTIYNAIDLERFVNKDNRIFDKSNVKIGNVARIMPEKKGQDILIEAIIDLQQEYCDIECWFAGDADVTHQKDFKLLKSKVKQCNLENNVYFLGTVDDIPAFLKEIDIFVLPSRFEGFGIALIEAMAMGVPCIASNLDGPAEIIEKEHGLLFSVGNVKELVEKLKYLIENYDLEKKKAEKNVQYIREKYNIKNMGKQLVDLYLNVEI